MVERKNNVLDPAKFFILVGLIVGVFYCIAIPYGAGFDEERHLVRIYYMSQGEFLPVFSGASVHQDVFELSYQRRLVQSPAFDMFSRESLTRRFSDDNNLRYGQKTQSIYSPVIFLPQAWIGRLLWWKFDFPVLPTIILQRIAGLLIYLACGYFAVRIVPFGKWIFAILVLSPTAMFQAATLNADGFTAGVSFAFIALVIKIFHEERMGIQPKSLWMLVFLSILLGVAKPGAIILFPLLLLIVRHPFPSKRWIIFLCFILIVSAAFNIEWSAYATRVSTYGEGGEQSVSRQSSLILSDPMGFLVPLLQGMVLTFPYQIQGWIAAYGYWAGKVPDPLYLFWAVSLLAAYFAEPEKTTTPRLARLFLVAFFVFCCVAFYTIAFVANYATGGVLALAKHGRYYIPFAPMFFLGVIGLFTIPGKPLRLIRYICAGSTLAVAAFYSLGIYTTYFTYCGYDAYVGGSCTQPLYKNLEKEDAPEESLVAGTEFSQTFTNVCGRLDGVLIYVSRVPEDSDGKLSFTLLDEHHEIVAQRKIPFREIIPHAYLTVSVDLPSDSRGGEFEIKLTTVDIAPSEEIAFLLIQAEYYPGEFIVDGLTRSRNLLLHYTCAGP